MTQPTLTIDLDAVAANWRALDALSAAETAAAVKADAYGCGAEPVARALAEAGCRSFFVATMEEGAALAEALKPSPHSRGEGWEGGAAAIHILNGVATAEEAAEAKARGLIPCLNHLGQIEAWEAGAVTAKVEAGFASEATTNKNAPCALHLDSGMSRLGLPPEEVPHVPEGLDVALLMSHLACADEPDHPANADQRERFLQGVAALRPVASDARLSLAATGGALLGAEYHFDLVRCGIGLYGGLPFADARPVVALTAPVLQIREIPTGQPVGYGCTWAAGAPTRIATLPLGYADGMHRALSNRGRVFIDGQPAPVAGRVSMDLITVDVSAFPNLQPGDPVEIVGPNQTIDDLATSAATIGYEMLTSLGSRYARRYKGDASAWQEPLCP